MGPAPRAFSLGVEAALGSASCHRHHSRHGHRPCWLGGAVLGDRAVCRIRRPRPRPRHPPRHPPRCLFRLVASVETLCASAQPFGDTGRAAPGLGFQLADRGSSLRSRPWRRAGVPWGLGPHGPRATHLLAWRRSSPWLCTMPSAPQPAWPPPPQAAGWRCPWGSGSTCPASHPSASPAAASSTAPSVASPVPLGASALLLIGAAPAVPSPPAPHPPPQQVGGTVGWGLGAPGCGLQSVSEPLGAQESRACLAFGPAATSAAGRCLASAALAVGGETQVQSQSVIRWSTSCSQ